MSSDAFMPSKGQSSSCYAYHKCFSVVKYCSKGPAYSIKHSLPAALAGQLLCQR